MGTCFESESIKLLQLQIFCITFTTFLSSFMSFIILYYVYFKKSHAPFKALITQGGKEGGGGVTITHYADFLRYHASRKNKMKY